jgi:hypothetical protein
METKTTHGFQLISKSSPIGEGLPSTLTSGIQQLLFPLRNPRAAIFISLPDVDHDEFISVLKNSGPATVIELRKIPRFDFGPLNRRSIFDLFREQGDVYLDLGTQEESDPQVVETKIQKTLQDHINRQRPIVFLTSSAQNPPSLAQSIFKLLRESGDHWEIYEVPYHNRATAGITA